ncbi:elongation of very long chain fatty acids protein 3 [Rhea pennata]|uniref:elongation of very long chain fatty acids protein 3 n=1 Tax=Rhea pennata TaxID=8795 RepID=UPI002E2772A0
MELSFSLSALPLLRQHDFERRFDEREAMRWMRDNWQKTFLFAVAYMVLIFSGQRVMKERTGYKLRTVLALWSLSLALFSAIGTHRSWKYVAFVLSTEGFKQLVCDQTFYIHPTTKLWAYLFVLSKVLELGDTVFIVLRKQRLMFLHWYHHVATLIYSWFAYKQSAPGGGLFITMNFTVHTFMYSYYAMRAAGFWVPRYIAMVITFLQILQMLVAVIVNILLLFWMENEIYHTTWSSVLFSSVMYLSYLVLFCNFFSKTYLTSAKKSKRE